MSREQIRAIYLCGTAFAASGATELRMKTPFGSVTLLCLNEGRVLLAAPEDAASAELIAALTAYSMFFATAVDDAPSSSTIRTGSRPLRSGGV